MKLPILPAALFAAVLAASPAMAQTKIDEMVGAWRITGEGRDCLAFLGTPQGMVMVASPASGGENNGGFAIAQPGVAADDSQETFLGLEGVSNFKGPLVVEPMEDTDPPIYWRSFPSATTIDAWPDSWTARLTRAGSTLVKVKVKGFTAARAALRSCVARTS